jgi:catechol 2,3-dioxygenase-like lactoylglutathione lyase family enzyme
VIAGAHVILYADDAGRARAFLRDVLGLEGVDAGGGWLILALPPAELAVHPVDEGTGGRHELYLMCDDVEQTVSALEARGVRFGGPVRDEGWGRLVRFTVPGAGEIGLYEPRHASPLRPFDASADG